MPWPASCFGWCAVRPSRREEDKIFNENDLTPMEQINEAWARYVDVLLLAGMDVSARQADELAALADRLAALHETEAAELRYRAGFWREYQPPGHPE